MQTTSLTHVPRSQDTWRLKTDGDRKPSLLFELTGSAGNLEMRPRLKDLFSHGLAKAAALSNAWVFTGGTDSGVMGMMGRAIRNQDPAGTKGVRPRASCPQSTDHIVQPRANVPVPRL